MEICFPDRQRRNAKGAPESGYLLNYFMMIVKEVNISERIGILYGIFAWKE